MTDRQATPPPRRRTTRRYKAADARVFFTGDETWTEIVHAARRAGIEPSDLVMLAVNHYLHVFFEGDE